MSDGLRHFIQLLKEENTKLKDKQEDLEAENQKLRERHNEALKQAQHWQGQCLEQTKKLMEKEKQIVKLEEDNAFFTEGACQNRSYARTRQSH